MDVRYKARRQEIEKLFKLHRKKRDETEVHNSPSGQYKLVVEHYAVGKDRWDYSIGMVIHVPSKKIICKIKRNYGVFWHSWVSHDNGFDYLLCGEDYQGYTTVNLTKQETFTHFPDEGYDGSGFCWSAAFPSPDSSILAVDGCYWACPYELVLYDFTQPDILPYKELKRIDSLADCGGWKDKCTFILTRDVELRKSDGKPYGELTEDEQELLDADYSLLESTKVPVEIDISDIRKDG
jgi:hypothetical protein